MIKKVLIPLIAVILFITAIGFLYQGKIAFPGKDKEENTYQPKLATQEITIDGNTYTVEVARTSEERKDGLSGRDGLNNNWGMLFIFETKDLYPSFWMKDMKFPLDILWVNDGEIVQINENALVQTVNNNSEYTIYRPSTPVDYVLEFNSGFAQENNIKVGSKVVVD